MGIKSRLAMELVEGKKIEGERGSKWQQKEELCPKANLFSLIHFF